MGDKIVEKEKGIKFAEKFLDIVEEGINLSDNDDDVNSKKKILNSLGLFRELLKLSDERCHIINIISLHLSF